MKTTIQYITQPMHITVAGLLIPLLTVCFAFSHQAQAQGNKGNRPTLVGPPVKTARSAQNVHFGREMLRALTPSGSEEGSEGNTASGLRALANNVGSFTSAFGESALLSNNEGWINNAFGAFALFNNVESEINNAFGTGALFSNTTGNSNNAFGHSALQNNVDGVFNNGFGFETLFDNVSGSFNTAIGDSAGHSITGDGNVCIGEGVVGVAGVNDSTFIRNINTTSQPPGVGVGIVTVDLTTGRLGRTQFAGPMKGISELEKAVEELKSQVARQEAIIKEQAAQIQRVSAQLEVKKPAAQLVNNNP